MRPARLNLARAGRELDHVARRTRSGVHAERGEAAGLGRGIGGGVMRWPGEWVRALGLDVSGGFCSGCKETLQTIEAPMTRTPRLTPARRGFTAARTRAAGARPGAVIAVAAAVLVLTPAASGLAAPAPT